MTARSPRLARQGIGPVLAGVVLLIVGVLSVGLLGGPLPLPGPVTAQTRVGDVPDRTPDPVVVFQPAIPQKPHVAGAILFSKAGNLWSVGGDDRLTQLTTGGGDGSPAWSPDGRTIYFVHVASAKGDVPCSVVAASGCIASVAHYTLEYPTLSSMPSAGGPAKAIESGLYTWGGGRYSYFYGLWQPALSPDGRTLAVISDAPDPLQYDYTVQLIPARGGALTRLRLPADYGLGLNDPAWSPDGRLLAYTYDHREGAVGRPRIAVLTVATGAVRFLTDTGYAQPSFSPDGRYLAAVRTSVKGRDVVILDAATGAELLRLTDDGRSFAPVWSPAGDQIAFLRANGLTLDLWLDTLAGRGTTFSVTKEEPLTSQSRLDGTSKPSWFIPPDEIPAPSSSAAPSSVGPSGSGASTSPGP